MNNNVTIRIKIIFIVSCLFLVSGFLSACQDKEKKQASIYYTCPMHPEVKKEVPGKCPICAMDLIKVDLKGQEVK